MFGKKKKRNHSWEHKVLAGVESAVDWSAPKLGAAADWAEGAYRKSAPKVQDASGRAFEAMQSGASAAGSKAKELSSKAGDGLAQQFDKLPPEAKSEVKKALKKYDQTKAQITNEYVPAASAKLGGYADKTAALIHKAEVDPRIEKALIKATGDKKIVKKLRKNSERYAKDAAKTLKKQQKSKSRKKGLLVFGLVAAGVTAGVAAWRASRPVEDPWKKPAPVQSSPAQVSTSSSPAAGQSSSAPKPAAGPAAQAGTDSSPKPQAPKPSAPSQEQSGTKTESEAQGTSTTEPKKATTEVPKPKPAT